MTNVSKKEIAMELIAPPPPTNVPSMPQKATKTDIKTLENKVNQRRFWGLVPPKPTIGLAAARFTESCEGGGRFCNNCAHFLSNAFILAGYTKLKRPLRYIDARCQVNTDPTCIEPGCDHTFKRPVRAREMEKWFQHMAKRKKNLSNTPGDELSTRFSSLKNTGFWAIFQHHPGGYYGGHVCIVDTDNWLYYGTGADGYWDWKNQRCYQW